MLCRREQSMDSLKVISILSTTNLIATNETTKTKWIQITNPIYTFKIHTKTSDLLIFQTKYFVFNLNHFFFQTNFKEMSEFSSKQTDF